MENYGVIRSCKVGFKVIAAIHAGLVTFDCSQCGRLGCEEPTQLAVWDDGEDEFFNCPIRFISDEIYFWYDKYKHGTRLEYEELNCRYSEAVNYYEYQLQRYKNAKTPNRQVLNGNNTDKLKALMDKDNGQHN